LDCGWQCLFQKSPEKPTIMSSSHSPSTTTSTTTKINSNSIDDESIWKMKADDSNKNGNDTTIIDQPTKRRLFQNQSTDSLYSMKDSNEDIDIRKEVEIVNDDDDDDDNKNRKNASTDSSRRKDSFTPRPSLPLFSVSPQTIKIEKNPIADKSNQKKVCCVCVF
jgi:hypothetical protein